MVKKWKIQIDKESEVPIREQVTEQFAVLIGTGKIKPGTQVPSIRALGKLLGIHSNTVSQAYQDLVDRSVLVRQRGSRMKVRTLERPGPLPQTKDLDDLINATIEAAQDNGYTLEQLSQRVRERLAAQPVDHILVVEPEPGLRQLIRQEISGGVNLPVGGCAPEDLTMRSTLAIGALVVCHKGGKRNIAHLLPKDQPFHPIWFSAADEHVELIRKLKEPSLIAIVSVSELLLQTARGLFAPVIGRRHTFREFFLPEEKPSDLAAADIVFCDSLARIPTKTRRVVHYQLMSSESLQSLSKRLKSLPTPRLRSRSTRLMARSG